MPEEFQDALIGIMKLSKSKVPLASFRYDYNQPGIHSGLCGKLFRGGVVLVLSSSLSLAPILNPLLDGPYHVTPAAASAAAAAAVVGRVFPSAAAAALLARRVHVVEQQPD